jgi:hypothetical protein
VANGIAGGAEEVGVIKIGHNHARRVTRALLRGPAKMVMKAFAYIALIIGLAVLTKSPGCQAGRATFEWGDAAATRPPAAVQP